MKQLIKKTDLINLTDVLEIEVTCIPESFVVAERLLSKGKNRLEILARELPHFNKHIQTEEEWNDYNDKHNTWIKRKNRVFKEFDDKFPEEVADRKKSKWFKENNFGKVYYNEQGQSFKPLHSYMLIENKGPRANDLERKMDKDRELHEMIGTLAEQIVEMNKQKNSTDNDLKDILKALIAKK